MSINIDDLIEQSTNSDPAERKRAIIALANTAERRGLDQLAIIAATDSDASLRELAGRAQRYMSEKLGSSTAPSSTAEASSSPSSAYSSGSSTWSSTPSGSTSAYDTAYSDPYATSKPASDFNSSTGRAYVNNAIGSHANGDAYGAKMWLAQALQAEPALASDPEVRALAATVTGLPSDKAILQLGTAPPEKAKREGTTTSSDSWLTLIIELVILFALVAGTTLLSLTLVKNNLASLTSLTTSSGSTLLRSSFTQFQSLAPAMFLVIAGIVGALSIVFSLIWITLLQLFSTMALGGVGTLENMLHALLRVSIVTTAAGIVPILLTFAALNQAIGSQTSMLNTANSLSSAIGLGSLIAQVYFVGKIQQFGVLRGCVVVVGAPILLSCVCFGLIYLAGTSSALTR